MKSSYSTIELYRKDGRAQALATPRACVSLRRHPVESMPGPPKGLTLLKSHSEPVFKKMRSFANLKLVNNMPRSHRLLSIERAFSERPRLGTLKEKLEIPKRMLPAPQTIDPINRTRGQSALFRTPDISAQPKVRMKMPLGIPDAFKTDEALVHFLIGEPKCRVLNLTNMTFVQKRTVCQLPRYAPVLNAISLSNLKFVDDSVIGAIVQIKSIEQIEACGCPLLTTAGLYKSVFPFTKNLISLRLDRSVLNTGQKKYKHLVKETICISGDTVAKEDAEFLFRLFSNNPKLRELSLAGCSLSSIHFQYLSSLLSMKVPLSNDPAEGGQGWQNYNAWVRCDEPASEMVVEPSLILGGEVNAKEEKPKGEEENIVIPQVGLLADNSRVIESMQDSLTINVKTNVMLGLQKLDLSYIQGVSHDAICSLFVLCHRLKHLRVQCWDALSDKTLKAISRACPRLQTIDASGCKSITENGVEDISNKCSMLEQVVLSGCSGISRFQSLKHLKRLCVLDVGNTKIKEEDLDVIVSECSFLGRVDVSFAKHITADYVNELCEEMQTERNPFVVVYKQRRKQVSELARIRMNIEVLKSKAAKNRQLSPTKKKGKKGKKKKRKGKKKR